MRIDAVDFFYLAMPEITDEADGSQDAVLVHVAGGGHSGWGECEASPLVSIAAFVCPQSHGACRPVSTSVLGKRIDGPDDIRRMAAAVAYNSMDLLQAAHTFSGVEMALWDLLGRVRAEPVWRLLGQNQSHRKRAYASQLFGDSPQETLVRAQAARTAGFAAVKFGWGPYGRADAAADADQVTAAREGLGDAVLLVDAGQVFGEDVEAAAARLPALEEAGALWLEEPFHAHALEAYRALARRSAHVGLAGGEGCHNVTMAHHLMEFGGVRYIQIDCGRIGGIAAARQVAERAAARGTTFVNHTFTSHLALSASLQPYAGLSSHRLCEYPFAPKALALDMTANHLRPDANGEIACPDAPGLGIEVNRTAAARYLVDAEIRVAGRTLYRSPALE
jgi:L-alanine-DL-glutamate epimerase-like enolase superfamily enzyme